MTRFEFYALPLALAGLLLVAAVCWACEFNPFGWARAEAHAFARERGGR